MRALIRLAIVNDATLQSEGIVSDGVLAGDVDTPTPRPWINLRWGTTTPGLSTVNRRSLQIWVHDTPADYSRIDRIIKRLRDLFAEIEAETHETGGWVLKVEWVTDSDDLRDDGHGTITRTTNYELVGSGF